MIVSTDISLTFPLMGVSSRPERYSRGLKDIRDGVPPKGIISAKFHLAVADFAKVSLSVREDRKLNRVALSGGVFEKVFLLRATTQLVRSDGFEVFAHRRGPINDGGISPGQAAIVNIRLSQKAVANR